MIENNRNIYGLNPSALQFFSLSEDCIQSVFENLNYEKYDFFIEFVKEFEKSWIYEDNISYDTYFKHAKSLAVYNTPVLWLVNSCLIIIYEKDIIEKKNVEFNEWPWRDQVWIILLRIWGYISWLFGAKEWFTLSKEIIWWKELNFNDSKILIIFLLYIIIWVWWQNMLLKYRKKLYK